MLIYYLFSPLSIYFCKQEINAQRLWKEIGSEELLLDPLRTIE